MRNNSRNNNMCHQEQYYPVDNDLEVLPGIYKLYGKKGTHPVESKRVRGGIAARTQSDEGTRTGGGLLVAYPIDTMSVRSFRSPMVGTPGPFGSPENQSENLTVNYVADILSQGLRSIAIQAGGEIGRILGQKIGSIIIDTFDWIGGTARRLLGDGPLKEDVPLEPSRTGGEYASLMYGPLVRAESRVDGPRRARRMATAKGGKTFTTTNGEAHDIPIGA